MTRSLLVATLTFSLGAVACSGDTDGTTSSPSDTGTTTTSDTGTPTRDTGVTTENPWVDTGSTPPEPECYADTQCASTQICLEANCEAALPRAYYFGDAFFTAPGTNPETGDAWDVGGGAPDPTVAIFVNDEVVCAFEEISDAFSGSWSGWCDPVMLYNGDDLEVALFDMDLTDADYMASCGGPVTAEMIRNGSVACEGGGFSFGAYLGL